MQGDKESDLGIRQDFSLGRKILLIGSNDKGFTIFNGVYCGKLWSVSLSGEYNNPVAKLMLTTVDGKDVPFIAFNDKFARQFSSDVGDKGINRWLVQGRMALLRGFEKVGQSHTLTIQYDPGRKPVYTGFIMLTISL